MNGGPSGFNNAPITRAFVSACAIFTIVFGIFNRRSNKLGLSYQDLFVKLQVWKLLASIFTFSSTPELMFGLYLLYYFRVFERQIGSNKYSVFVLFSVVVSLLLEVLALTLLIDTRNVLTSGPYGLIFSSFIPFYLDIPVSTRFRVCGLHFSDKTFTYLAGLQLLLSSWRRSFLPGVCGILAGTLYRMNFFRIRRLKFPELFASFFSRISGPSNRSTAPTAPNRNFLGNLPSFTAQQPEGNLPAPVSNQTEPLEDSIATLVSMGFDRNSARQALMRAGNDVNTATNILLEALSH